MRSLQQDWSVSASNDVLLLALRAGAVPPLQKPDAAKLFGSVDSGSLEQIASGVGEDAASFAGSFRDAAVCAFQVLRSQHGKRVAPWLQNYRASELHEAARGYPAYPVLKEVMREHASESLDFPGLKSLLERIERGKVRMVFRDVESPSPFAHSVLVQDITKKSGEFQMGRERRAHLLRLHRQVLQEVLSAEQMAQILDSILRSSSFSSGMDSRIKLAPLEIKRAIRPQERAEANAEETATR